MFCSTDINPASVIRNGVDDILDKFHRHLTVKYGRDYCYSSTTPYALQFTLYGEMEVDLLPSPKWKKYSFYLKDIAGMTPDDRRK